MFSVSLAYPNFRDANFDDELESLMIIEHASIWADLGVHRPISYRRGFAALPLVAQRLLKTAQCLLSSKQKSFYAKKGVKPQKPSFPH